VSELSPPWDELIGSANRYEEGDVMAVASWIRLLGDLAADGTPERAETFGRLAADLKQALQSGALEGLDRLVGAALDGLDQRGPRAPTDLWTQHGPAFVSETRNRLARAEEIVLLLDDKVDAELVGELFRLFHTVKREAGFLNRDDLSTLAHRTEELLEPIRSGKARWDAPVADRVLAGIDELKGALGGSRTHRTAQADDVLRVPASKIDALISQIGELLIAQESAGDVGATAVKKLGRALQKSAMYLRTEPLTDLMNRLKRGARDLGKSLGKPLEVVLVGQELELDRTLISRLEEPLMHLIRNAIDHGLEAPERRRGLGKAPEGKLTLQAERRGNRIAIKFGDDGRGLDAEKIWKKGVERGLVAGARPLDTQGIYPLIFEAGFSTAEQLSEVSGRGVGMDIVLSSVRSARGRIDLETEAGTGTTVVMTFPLSTAVLDALVVKLDDQRFLLPVDSCSSHC